MSLTTTTTTSTSRSYVWRAFSQQIAGLVGVKPRASASKRKHRSLPPTSSPFVAPPAATHRRMSAASLRPALRRGSTASSTSCSSGESSPSPVEKITFPIISPKADEKVLLPANTKYNAGLPIAAHPTKDSSYLRLLPLTRIFTITRSTRQRRTSRVFPDLPPPAEWDEVSLTIESDDWDSDSEDSQVLPEADRKVRFMVPAPPPPAVEEDWDEEPVWSDFMVR
ncbi:hypothetical protein C8R44DRAFT_889513 [Mycena epipterygia]|nr:hypothetical protein C8R44DRAFT_889513 [Mycena epipterygia]